MSDLGADQEFFYAVAGILHDYLPPETPLPVPVTPDRSSREKL
jgi:hypothetical protein